MTAEGVQVDPGGVLNDRDKDVCHVNLRGRNRLFNILNQVKSRISVKVHFKMLYFCSQFTNADIVDSLNGRNAKRTECN